MNNKQSWKAFFELEQSFYDYVIENCDELYSQNPPVFTVDPELSKPPKYIRWIGRLKHGSSEFETRLVELQQAYKLTVGEDFKNYPVRFCEFYQNVDQINITTNSAFRSRSLKSGFCTLFLIEEDDNIAELIKQLEKYGIESRVHVEQSLLGIQFHFFQVNIEDLFEYFKTDKIQARAPSGHQFRARIRFKDESAGERIKLGFIVVDSDSTCRVVRSNEQAERPHSLVKQGRELFLPIDREIDTLFFDKA